MPPKQTPTDADYFKCSKDKFFVCKLNLLMSTMNQSPSVLYQKNRFVLYSGIAVVVLIVAIVALLAMTYLYRLTEERTVSTTKFLASSMNLTFEGLIDNIDVVLQASGDEISRQISGGKPNVQSISNYLERQHKRLSHVAFLRATNARGDLMYGKGVLSPPNNNADREYFIRLKDEPTAGLYINKPLLGRVEKKWVWLFVRRINLQNGAFGGVVIAGINIDEIENILAQISIGSSNSIAFRDEDYGLIARNESVNTIPIEIGSKQLSTPFTEALKNNALQGSYISGVTSIDGINRTHFYLRNTKYRFTTNVGISRDDSLSVWRKQAWTVAGLTLVFFFAVIAYVRLNLRSEKALLESEEHFRLLYDTTIDGVLITAPDGRVLGANPSACKMFQRTEQEILQVGRAGLVDTSDPRLAIALEERKRTGKFMGELTMLRKDGTKFIGEISTSVFFDRDGNAKTSMVIRDITQRILLEEQISNLASFDYLTKLPNRRLLEDRLGQGMAASKRSGCYGAILFLDLDNFKPLNDKHGHAIGDLLLIEVARRISSCIRETDTAARFGGDEFVVMLPELEKDKANSIAQVSIVAEKIRVTLAEPYLLTLQNGVNTKCSIEHHCTSSIGAVLFYDHETSIEDIFMWADKAMYEAKVHGRNQIQFYEQSV